MEQMKKCGTCRKWNSDKWCMKCTYEQKDLVDVIRCKDCKFYKKNGCLWSCDIHELTIVGTDDFCSFAERKEQ